MATRPMWAMGLKALKLTVPNLDEAVAFYRDALTMVPRLGDHGGMELTLGDVGVRLEEGPACPSALALAVPVWELLSAKARLEAMGFEVSGPEDRGGREQVVSLSDPGGNRIELVAKGTPADLHESRPDLPKRPGGRHDSSRWADYYSRVPVDKMPWYTEKLDCELLAALVDMAPLPGRFLELGCGAGTASARLAALGYEVLGVDIAPAAVEYARARYGRFDARLSFEVANILEPMDRFGRFDYAFDRGCFHTLDPASRGAYVDHVAGALKSGGRLFLKVFSRVEPGEWGPHRFEAEEVAEIFSGAFRGLRDQEVSFQGNLPVHPRGLFFVLERT